MRIVSGDTFLFTRLAARGALFLAASVAVAAVAPGTNLAEASSSPWVNQPILWPAHAVNIVNAVSCSSESFCMAAGSTTYHGDITHALTEDWNGTQWSLVSVPPVPHSLPTAVFNGVSCPTRHFCMAVGYFDRNRTLYPFAARWNGARWELQLPSNQDGRFFGQLEGVSCPTTKMCLAVGLGGTSERSEGALAERWNGRGWTASVKYPPHGWTAVSCPSTRACIAIASGWSGSFNGRGWTIHKGPNIASLPAQASALSCVSANSCMAVGAAGLGPRYINKAPLAAYWNGRRWTDKSVPYPPPPPAQGTQCYPNGCIPGQSYQYTSPSLLTGVSCLASNDCYAAGMVTDTQNGLSVRVIPHWNGSSWTTPAPLGNGGSPVVSCLRVGICEIVGNTATSATALEAARYG